MHSLPEAFPARRTHLDFRGVVVYIQRARAIRLDLDDCRLVQLSPWNFSFLRAHPVATKDTQRTGRQTDLLHNLPGTLGRRRGRRASVLGRRRR